MPKISGKELATQLAVSRPEMKIIFMSGYTDDLISHHGVLDTSVTLINKPIIPAKLAKIIRNVLDDSIKDLTNHNSI